SEIDDVDVLLAWYVGQGSGPHQVKAFEALVMRLYRSDPVAGWQLQQDTPSWVPSGAERALVEAAGSIGKRALIDSALPATLRRLGATAATGAGLLESDVIIALLDDADDDVRRIALIAAFDQGVAVTVDQVVTALNRGPKWAADDQA